MSVWVFRRMGGTCGDIKDGPPRSEHFTDEEGRTRDRTPPEPQVGRRASLVCGGLPTRLSGARCARYVEM